MINYFQYNIILSFTPNIELNSYVCIERGDNLLKKVTIIYFLFFVVLNALAANEGVYKDDLLPNSNTKKPSVIQADSIMRLVIESAEKYQKAVSKYESEIYIKGRTEILKQNILMRFAHHLFPINRKNKDMLFEMVSKSKYNAPNTYFHDFQAINGNSIPNSHKQQEVLTFLNLNVYSPTIYNDGIITPVARKAFKYYSFNLESIEDSAGLRIYKIRFIPKLWSQKLICGDLYIVDNYWTIDKIDVNGRFSFAEFNMVMTFGRNFRRFILPEKADLELRYRVLGNVVACTYHSTFKYNAVEWAEADYENRKTKSLDMTSYYRLSSDTVPIIRDTAYWNQKRDIPLSETEKIIYDNIQDKVIRQADTSNMTKYLKLTEKLTNSINLNYKTTRLKYSGILNPFQLGYSGRNGITYRQQLRLSKTFSKDRQLRFRPEIGYVFKRKELFFKLGGDWEYFPEKRGQLSLFIGNGNEGYSSKIMKEINEQLKDSAFNFENLNLQYFKDYFVELRNSIELFNGFEVSAGVSYHRRIPVKKNTDEQVGDGVTNIINENYHDFTPMIGFSYTPRQHYWMDGYRKEYLYSYYPTFSIEIAQGIPGVGKSTGSYGLVEADIQQSIYLGLSRKLNYHLSGGLYTNQKSTYFANFRYFARRNFPESWDDNFGGVFNQLKGEWYNASDKYAQFHLMYESPFMLMQLFKPRATKNILPRAAKYILTERFYLSQLWTPVLPSYTEMGYGFGNHIFNAAVFVGFNKLEYQSIGFKFAFELFQ